MKTAIIIGAGPAGLTAAYELLSRNTGGADDIYPIILEASGEFGGISRTHIHNGKRMDIGGHRFFSKNAEVMKLWLTVCPPQGAPARDDRALGRSRELAPGGPDPETAERVMLRRGRVSRILYLRKFFDYPISMKPATFRAMGFGRTVRAGMGYVKAALFKRPERTLEDFMINRFGKPLYQMFFEDYNRKVWGYSPAQMAPDWGAQRIKGLSLWKAFAHMLFGARGKTETSLIEEFYYPKLGPGQLWEAMAVDIQGMGGEIRMDSRVTGIQTDVSRITAVTVETPTERYELSGDWFFSSMPIKELVAALPAGQTPAPVREIAAALPYRDFITVGLLVDSLAIRNETNIPTLGELVPDCWIYIQERDVKIGRLQIFNNWSPYMTGGAEGVWIGLEYFCFEGDELWEMDDPAFIGMAVGELTRVGVLAAGAPIRDSVRLRVPKAYPAYIGAYEHFGTVRDYLDSLENLFCIGRNGQHRYNNMDHSMLTALTAARMAREGGSDRTALWAVNTEEEYHEEVKR